MLYRSRIQEKESEIRQVPGVLKNGRFSPGPSLNMVSELRMKDLAQISFRMVHD